MAISNPIERDKILREIGEDISKTLESDTFKCPACKNPVKEPRHLPCRHILCSRCFARESTGVPSNNKKARQSKEKLSSFAKCPVKGCETNYNPQEHKTSLDINLGRSMRFFGDLKKLVEVNVGKTLLVEIEQDEQARETGGTGKKKEEENENLHVQVTSGGRVSSALSSSGEHERCDTATSDGSSSINTAEQQANNTTTRSGSGCGKQIAGQGSKKPQQKKKGDKDKERKTSEGLSGNKVAKKQRLVVVESEPAQPPPKSVTPPPKQQQQVATASTSNTSNCNTGSSSNNNNIDKKNPKGETPLQRACKKKNGAIDEVRKLLEAGASPNVCDNAGWTPLHEAAQRGDAEVLEALIARGANVNVKSMQEGTTPLHDAVVSFSLRAVEVLLKAGANPAIQDFSRRTPLDGVIDDAIRAALLKAMPPAGDGMSQKSDKTVASSTSSSHPVAFAMSGFGSSQTTSYVEKLRTSASLLGRLCDAITTPDVTHLVVATLQEDDRVCSRRSLKFLQAVARGTWIVGIKWLEESLKVGTWLPEVDFEVTGCSATGGPTAGGAKRSRLAHQQNSGQEEPPLFSSCGFFFQGHFEVPASIDGHSLHALVECLGGKVLKREPRFKLSLAALGLKAPPVYHAPPDSNVRDYSVFIIRDPALTPLTAAQQIRAPPLATVTYDWFLTCIETWRLNELPPVS